MNDEYNRNTAFEILLFQHCNRMFHKVSHLMQFKTIRWHAYHISLFCRHIWSSKKLSNFLKITHLESGRGRIWTEVCLTLVSVVFSFHIPQCNAITELQDAAVLAVGRVHKATGGKNIWFVCICWFIIVEKNVIRPLPLPRGKVCLRSRL